MFVQTFIHSQTCINYFFWKLANLWNVFNSRTYLNIPQIRNTRERQKKKLNDFRYINGNISNNFFPSYKVLINRFLNKPPLSESIDSQFYSGGGISEVIVRKTFLPEKKQKKSYNTSTQKFIYDKLS